MAGYSGISMSNNAVQAYDEGKKPVSRITKEDILKYGINESITFFRWFVKKYCLSSEWHHTSPKYNMTTFYDIKQCCDKFNASDFEKIKNEYRDLQKSKPQKEVDTAVYYAKVEYSISKYRGGRKYISAYAVICRGWAYVKDDYNNKITKKRIDSQHFTIIDKHQSRPEEMPKELEDIRMTVCNQR